MQGCGARVRDRRGHDCTRGAYATTLLPLCVDWSPEASEFCIGTEDGRALIVTVGSDEPARELSAHSDWVWDVEWHPARDQLITVSADGSVGVWRISKLTLEARIGRFTRGVSAAAWSPAQNVIVSSSAEGNFCLWNVDRRQAIGEFSAHNNWIRAIQFYNDGGHFLTASQDGTIGMWSASDGQPIMDRVDLEIGGLWAATLTNDRRVAAVSDTGHLCIVDPLHLASVRSYKLEEGWLRGLAWSPDGGSVAVGSSTSGRLYILRGTDLSTRRRVDLGTPCFACAISPDSEEVAVALGDGSIRLLRISDGLEVFVFRGHESEAWSVAFSRDGEALVSAGADGTVRVWQIGKKDPIRVFRLETSCISATFSKQGEVLFGSAGAWTLDPVTADSVPGSEARTLTDSPVAILDGPAERDLLGRRPLVEELAFFLHRAAEHSRELARGKRPPEGFVVHVGGRWGSGKTSLTKHLIDRVQLPEREPRKSGDSSDTLRHWDSVWLSAWAAVG